MTAISITRRAFLLGFFMFAPLTAHALFAIGETPPQDPSYYQCLIKAAHSNADPEFIDANGYLGIYRLSVNDAKRGGLCTNDIPATGARQIWALCDFKGPVALQYGITNEDQLRTSRAAVEAQSTLARNLTAVYDTFIFNRRYDLLYEKPIRGFTMTPDILRGLLFSFGDVVTDEYLTGKKVVDGKGKSPYSFTACFQQCIFSKAEMWNCNQ